MKKSKRMKSNEKRNGKSTQPNKKVVPSDSKCP